MRFAFDPSPLNVKTHFACFGVGAVETIFGMTITTTTFWARSV
jgi:hypothetical protein